MDRSLTLHQVHLEREQWLNEAETAEKAGAARTAAAIIRETLAMGVEEEDRKRIWLEACHRPWNRRSLEAPPPLGG